MDRGFILGELARRGRDWFVSVERCHGLEPGGLVLVRFRDYECVCLLEQRRFSVRFDCELWKFRPLRPLLRRPLGATDYDQEAQAELWARELAQLQRDAPVQTIGAPPKPRRRRRRRAPPPRSLA